VDLECNRTSPKSDGLKMGIFKENGKMGSVTSQGRFPANLLVSDNALDTEYDKGTKPHSVKSNTESYEGWGNITKKQGEVVNYGDSGYASRYFDLDAWASHHGLLDVPKPDKSERDYGLKLSRSKKYSDFGLKTRKEDGLTTNKRTNNQASQSRNNHPTVKPIKLMAYLIELGCPPGGIVLDPFVGSGTTCIAAKQLQRKYIGIELDENYHRLAEARLAAYPDPIEWFKDEVRTKTIICAEEEKK